jgi:hypothetical protein
MTCDQEPGYPTGQSVSLQLFVVHYLTKAFYGALDLFVNMTTIDTLLQDQIFFVSRAFRW